MWIKRLLIALVVLAGVVSFYFWLAMTWSYSSGERAGWVQKFSHKGWVYKTWEGELALVSLPGSAVEKFYFTVHDEAAAAQIQQAMGKRGSNRNGVRRMNTCASSERRGRRRRRQPWPGRSGSRMSPLTTMWTVGCS